MSTPPTIHIVASAAAASYDSADEEVLLWVADFVRHNPLEESVVYHHREEEEEEMEEEESRTTVVSA